MVVCLPNTQLSCLPCFLLNGFLLWLSFTFPRPSRWVHSFLPCVSITSTTAFSILLQAIAYYFSLCLASTLCICYFSFVPPFLIILCQLPSSIWLSLCGINTFFGLNQCIPQHLVSFFSFVCFLFPLCSFFPDLSMSITNFSLHLLLVPPPSLLSIRPPHVAHLFTLFLFRLFLLSLSKPFTQIRFLLSFYHISIVSLKITNQLLVN